MYDVAIIGGGPAGSTAGSILKKYSPELSVLILEREKFPRDHVGESQLPPISQILDEMGCWDKVEAADFPIKIGATYRWGKSPELWDFEFLPAGDFEDAPRPGKFDGQRKYLAFQVDRAIYDDILLKHAAELGCEVRQETKVLKVLATGDHVNGLQLADGTTIEAKYYLDASGHSGILRRALGVKADSPTTLQNIAIWDYWQNAEWAVEIGVSGTRIQILSVDFGWIWFIPLGPTRTSIGLVVPGSYYKSCGMKMDALYAKALEADPLVRELIKGAESENLLQATKDWSFLSDRHVGDNWFLIGESAGFADPILSAGLTLAHVGAREAAITIIEMENGKHKKDWLKQEFESRQMRRIMNHIRFADYWYTANEQFADLKEFTKRLASENGLEMTPEDSWRWIAQGGFITDTATVSTGGFAMDQVRAMHGLITDYDPEAIVSKTNHFKLNLSDAKWHERPNYGEGVITKYPCYERGEKVLPLHGVPGVVVNMLERSSQLSDLIDMIAKQAEAKAGDDKYYETVLRAIPITLEAMIIDGWVDASYDPSAPLVAPPARNTGVHWNTDTGDR